MSHGAVHPFYVLPHANHETLEHAVSVARVPVWLRWPMPGAWLVSGVAYAGDDRTGARATLLAASGGGPLGGPCDMVVVAEEPGIGLGARYAGLPGPDPGDGFDLGPPHAKVIAHDHPTPLWTLPAAEDCAAFVGEALGQWLWVIVWPAPAGVLLYDELELVDLRERTPLPELDFAPLLPRLATPDTPPASPAA